MVLQLSISDDAEAKLKARAAAAGINVEAFISQAVEQLAAAEPTLDEILAPLHREFEDSGMTEKELIDLLETAKHEMRYGSTGRPS
ncbi:MAG TPA: hypothetical protein VFE58_11515 [Tepidisphaeraceae bacterium]|jgi:hypothetical protein|nr:hypothetical protein [Tepidisphaeraceae bacterium]